MPKQLRCYHSAIHLKQFVIPVNSYEKLKCIRLNCSHDFS